MSYLAHRSTLGLLAALALLAAPASSQTTADLVRDLEWRNIGPANMAGRVTDIDALEADFAHVVVGSASGGVWKSTNAGTTWTQIFADYGSGNIGDVAIFQPNPDIIWVGTGESCTRNSVSWGDGVYKSMDGGVTFERLGLSDTHHVSEVLTHPTDPDIAYVAAQGHLWGHTGERGIYKTTDGGRSWTLLGGGLPADGRTGASDLKMDPSDPDVLYAAFWERIRMPHRFLSGGPNGGIFKSTDAGATWTKLTDGLPGGATGKIGLAIHRADPRIVMAIVEHGFQPEQGSPEYEDMSRLGTGIYRSEDGGASWAYISRYNNRPFYYSHIWIDPADDQRVYVLAGSAQISEDGGRTFDRSMEGISGDFHALWINPSNPQQFYVGNDKGAYVTFNQGHEFVMFDNMDIGEFYAVTADNRDPYWVYGGLQDNGNWGGPSNSRDWNGVLNDHWFKFHSGDGFHTTVDPDDWRTVYTESQGGNIRRYDAIFRQQGKTIRPLPETILNYTDFVPDYRPGAEPAGGGFGGGGGGGLPRERFRFNWSSPLRLSPHDSNTLLFGGNHLFRSYDRGDTWTIISPDLSTQDTALVNPESGGLTRDVTSAETHATIITISESPVTPGLIWVGTDDGRVHVTRDDGRSWTDVGVRLPSEVRGLWVSRVAASRFHEGTAYVSKDGHRSDDFHPWIFKTTDYGQTWTRVSAGLPDGNPIYVVREDPKNADLLYAGSEFGAFVSADGGGSWTELGTGLPTVAVHDLIIHPREGDVIAATHGRSVWILDDVTALQQLDDEVRASAVHVFQQKTATTWKGISRGATRGHKLFMGRNPLTIQQVGPGNSPNELVNTAAIHFWLGSDGPAEVEISSVDGAASVTHFVDGHAGVNRFFWDMRWAPTEEAVAAYERQMEQLREQFGGQIPGFFQGRGPEGESAGLGSFRVRVTKDGRTSEGVLRVRDDPGLEGVLPSVR